MISSKRSIFYGFIYKVEKLYDFEVQVNWLTRTLTFTSPEEAAKCFDQLWDSRGVILKRRGRKLRVSTHRTITLID